MRRCKELRFVTWPYDPSKRSYFLIFLKKNTKTVFVQQSATVELLLELFQFQDEFCLIIPEKYLKKKNVSLGMGVLLFPDNYNSSFLVWDFFYFIFFSF